MLRFHNLGPKPYHLPGNKEALSTRSSLLYCHHFSLALFHNQAAGQKGSPAPGEPLVTPHHSGSLQLAGSESVAGGRGGGGQRGVGEVGRHCL